MSVRRISAVVFASAVMGGCASLENNTPDWIKPTSYFGSDDPVSEGNPLDSEEVTVAAGDQSLKETMESGNSQGTSRTELDEAISPGLKAAAEDARAKLDSPSDYGKEDVDQTVDLWHRLRAGFELDHDVANPRVKAQLDWYRKHPRYIDRVVKRGSRYLHYIITETEKRGLPTELALLPVVESAFDPFAYSHGRASGLWQFIPSTGKYFGLTQSWWHDDRRDIIESTEAALTYLDRLAKRFDGDYTLALAAYNSGGGTVSKAMRRNRNANRSTDYWSLKLPRETTHYVPKLIALAKIFDKPEDYGVELPALNDEPYFEVVETDSQMDLAQAAELASVDVEEIYLLNPSFNRWATAPDGPHRLLVPKENASTFRTALSKIPAKDRVSWSNYEVVSGDTLSTIARKFATTTPVIRRVNNLNSDMIRVGQRLMIPSASKSSGEYALSANQRLEKKQSRNRSGNRVNYTIRRGDTFWDIAREHRVTVRQVAAWNNMAPGDPLIPGKKIVIWSQASQPKTVASNNRGQAMVRKVGYRVRKGDSLSAIASRFSVNVRDIASWNDLNSARYLQPGQSLVLYVDIRNSP
ncbi:MAG: LysM peptidoglycan-binding domain-containing protein [Marinobacter sp.]